MKFQSIIPMIWNKELLETAGFYCDILGFTCGNYNEDFSLRIEKQKTENREIEKRNRV